MSEHTSCSSSPYHDENKNILIYHVCSVGCPHTTSSTTQEDLSEIVIMDNSTSLDCGSTRKHTVRVVVEELETGQCLVFDLPTPRPAPVTIHNACYRGQSPTYVCVIGAIVYVMHVHRNQKQELYVRWTIVESPSLHSGTRTHVCTMNRATNRLYLLLREDEKTFLIEGHCLQSGKLLTTTTNVELCSLWSGPPLQHTDTRVHLPPDIPWRWTTCGWFAYGRHSAYSLRHQCMVTTSRPIKTILYANAQDVNGFYYLDTLDTIRQVSFVACTDTLIHQLVPLTGEKRICSYYYCPGALLLLCSYHKSGSGLQILVSLDYGTTWLGAHTAEHVALYHSSALWKRISTSHSISCNADNVVTILYMDKRTGTKQQNRFGIIRSGLPSTVLVKTPVQEPLPEQTTPPVLCQPIQIHPIRLQPSTVCTEPQSPRTTNRETTYSAACAHEPTHRETTYSAACAHEPTHRETALTNREIVYTQWSSIFILSMVGVFFILFSRYVQSGSHR